MHDIFTTSSNTNKFNNLAFNVAIVLILQVNCIVNCSTIVSGQVVQLARMYHVAIQEVHFDFFLAVHTA